MRVEAIFFHPIGIFSFRSKSADYISELVDVDHVTGK
jgi:hypothetical protein